MNSNYNNIKTINTTTTSQVGPVVKERLVFQKEGNVSAQECINSGKLIDHKVESYTTANNVYVEQPKVIEIRNAPAQYIVKEEIITTSGPSAMDKAKMRVNEGVFLAKEKISELRQKSKSRSRSKGPSMADKAKAKINEEVYNVKSKINEMRLKSKSRSRSKGPSMADKAKVKIDEGVYNVKSKINELRQKSKSRSRSKGPSMADKAKVKFNEGVYLAKEKINDLKAKSRSSSSSTSVEKKKVKFTENVNTTSVPLNTNISYTNGTVPLATGQSIKETTTITTETKVISREIPIVSNMTTQIPSVNYSGSTVYTEASLADKAKAKISELRQKSKSRSRSKGPSIADKAKAKIDEGVYNVKSKITELRQKSKSRSRSKGPSIADKAKAKFNEGVYLAKEKVNEAKCKYNEYKEARADEPSTMDKIKYRTNEKICQVKEKINDFKEQREERKILEANQPSTMDKVKCKITEGIESAKCKMSEIKASHASSSNTQQREIIRETVVAPEQTNIHIHPVITIEKEVVRDAKPVVYTTSQKIIENSNVVNLTTSSSNQKSVHFERL